MKLLNIPSLPIILSFRLVALVGFAVVTQAFAELNIDYVTVGDINNDTDPSTGSLYGAGDHPYQIGKFEVTNAQYTEYLNAVDPAGANANGIYNISMGSDARGGIIYTSGAASGEKYTIRTNMGDKPVNYVSWYDAARFANWLHNGQGSGSTETGAYTLSGNTGIITRNVGATVWIPSEDEWYKAAYYNGDTEAYSLYPTQSDTVPTEAAADATGNISNSGANVANYNSGADWNSQNGNVTTVGGAGANNYYGTFDQGGNVFEWNEAVISGSLRGMRGGSWYDNESFLRSSGRFASASSFEASYLGFRVARAVPVLKAEVATAIEFYFNSTLGKTYLIEESTDMSAWTPLESGIAGTGEEIVRLYSTRNVPKRFLRVSEEAP